MKDNPALAYLVRQEQLDKLTNQTTRLKLLLTLASDIFEPLAKAHPNPSLRTTLLNVIYELREAAHSAPQ